MALHTKLKEYRESKGLKQADLADLVHVRRETIVNLEKGKYQPLVEAGNGYRKCLSNDGRRAVLFHGGLNLLVRTAQLHSFQL